jgi:hypothetical protein
VDPKSAAIRTRMTVETAKQIVLRRARTAPGNCPFCGAAVELVVLAKDGVGESVTLRQIQSWFGHQEFHFWKNPLGYTEICLPSLFECLEQSDIRNPGFRKDFLNPIKEKDHEDE